MPKREKLVTEKEYEELHKCEKFPLHNETNFIIPYAILVCEQEETEMQ